MAIIAKLIAVGFNQRIKYDRNNKGFSQNKTADYI
jgi:hypothetical protein